MNPRISTTTAGLIESLIQPLAKAGAIHQTERDAVLTLLKSASHEQTENAPKPRRLLTLEETAQRLQLSRKTVSRMVQRGELKACHLRPGSTRTLRIHAASVEGLEDSR